MMTISLVHYQPNLIYGLSGNDELTGGPFADQIYGGDGDDDFFTTAGADFYDGEGGFTNELIIGLMISGQYKLTLKKKRSHSLTALLIPLKTSNPFMGLRTMTRS